MECRQVDPEEHLPSEWSLTCLRAYPARTIECFEEEVLVSQEVVRFPQNNCRLDRRRSPPMNPHRCPRYRISQFAFAEQSSWTRQ